MNAKLNNNKTLVEDELITLNVGYEKISREEVTITVPSHQFMKTDGSLDTDELEEHFRENGFHKNPDHVSCVDIHNMGFHIR